MKTHRFKLIKALFTNSYYEVSYLFIYYKLHTSYYLYESLILNYVFLLILSLIALSNAFVNLIYDSNVERTFFFALNCRNNFNFFNFLISN